MNLANRGVSAFLGSFAPFARRPARRRPGILASMPKKKYYAIRVGRNGFKGVVSSWETCKAHIDGVRNARFKSFPTMDAANEFVNDASGVSSVQPAIKKTSRDKSGTKKSLAEIVSPFSVDGKEPLIVYTDGACKGNGRHGATAGYGVFFGDGHELNVSEPLPGSLATNQRAEMMAVVIAMKVSFEKELVSKDKGLLILTDSRVSFRSGIVVAASEQDCF